MKWGCQLCCIVTNWHSLSSLQYTSSKYKRIYVHLGVGTTLRHEGHRLYADHSQERVPFMSIATSLHVLLCSCFACHMHPERAPCLISQDGGFDTLRFYLWMNGKTSLIQVWSFTHVLHPPPYVVTSRHSAIHLPCLPCYQVLRIQPRQPADDATAVAPVKKTLPKKSVCKLETCTTRFYWHTHTHFLFHSPATTSAVHTLKCTYGEEVGCWSANTEEAKLHWVALA